MKILPMSDIHNEFLRSEGTYFEFPLSEEEARETICILAGDIETGRKHIAEFYRRAANHYAYVIAIFGNHEFYGTSIHSEIEKVKELTADIDNLYILEKESVEIAGMRFLGTTLWSDFCNNDQLMMYNCKLWMNDYKKIRYGTHAQPYMKKLEPMYVSLEFRANRNWLESQLAEKFDGPTIVITHHAPSHNLAKWNYDDQLYGAYGSNLEHMFFDYEIDMWVFGHVHKNYMEQIGDTLVISNCKGYPSQEVQAPFREKLLIDFSGE